MIVSDIVANTNSQNLQQNNILHRRFELIIKILVFVFVFVLNKYKTNTTIEVKLKIRATSIEIIKYGLRKSECQIFIIYGVKAL